MAFEQASAAGSDSFGAGRLVDEFNRFYRLAAARQDDPLPGLNLFALTRSVDLQKRVLKRSREAKQELSRSDKRRSLFFPQKGEHLVLRRTPQLQRLVGGESGVVEAVVAELKPRGSSSQTALVRIVAR